MKQLIRLFILVSTLLLPTNYLLAEGHSGSYDLKAYFTGSASSNGSPQQGFTANYDGMVVAVDVEGSSSIFNNSSHHCVGSISMVAGKGTEKATCKIALADSEDGEFIFFHIDSVFPAPDGIKKGKASAVLAASIFHYGKYSIKEAKKYLISKNIPVRI